MTGEPQRKSSFSTGRNRAGSINTPRFAAQAVHHGQTSTAERHTLPALDVISSQNSADELGSNIPGSYPQEDMSRVSQMLKKHRDIGNPKHLGTVKVDLPLEERPSGARQGVGSLPGPNAECGVAILPDERHPDRIQEDAEDSPLPSKEHPSGSRVGVGSLPGKNNEAGVATLPEERINGRPFGQSHTGFEKTLGNERTHVDIDTPATRTKAEHAHKETIFSATQRELKRDPDFLSHRGAFFQQPHEADLSSAEGVKTFVQGAAGAVYVGAEGLFHGAQGALQSFEERFKGQDPIQATKDMIQNLEARFGTEDTIRRAKEQVQSFEGRLEAGAGDAVLGAKGMIHNLEACFAPAQDVADAEPSANVTNRDLTALQNSSDQDQAQSSTNMFAKTGPDTTDSGTTPSSVSVPHTPTSDSQRMSGVPSTLPQSLQKEYLRSSALLPPEDYQTAATNGTSPTASKGEGAKGIAVDGAISNADRAQVLSSNDNGVPDIEGEETARGMRNVQYYTKAQGGMLPGFPTPEGMAVLINDRLKDDQARSGAQSGNGAGDAFSLFNPNITTSGRARLMHDVSPASAEAVRGSYSSEFLPSTVDTPDPTIDNRIIEERHEVPVFEGGSIRADGKYEAVFRPVSDYPEELLASSALHRAHQHHDLHRPSRSAETKDLSGQFTRPGHLKPVSSTGQSKTVDDNSNVFSQPTDAVERVHDEQLVRTDHPNEAEERPDFRGRPADTAFGEYQATYRPVGMSSATGGQVPARLADHLLPPHSAQQANHPHEIDELPTFTGTDSETAAGKYKATLHPTAMEHRQIPVSHSHVHPTTMRGQAVPTNDMNQTQAKSEFVSGSEAVEGRHEGIYVPAGAALGTTQKMDIDKIPPVQLGQTRGTTKEVPAYLGKPLSGKQPVQEQHVPQKKTLN